MGGINLPQEGQKQLWTLEVPSEVLCFLQAGATTGANLLTWVGRDKPVRTLRGPQGFQCSKSVLLDREALLLQMN